VHNTFGESHIYVLEVGQNEDRIPSQGLVGSRSHVFKRSLILFVTIDTIISGRFLENFMFRLLMIVRDSIEFPSNVPPMDLRSPQKVTHHLDRLFVCICTLLLKTMLRP